jgi:uncharacterized membrane protein YhaH (DUF805 family)
MDTVLFLIGLAIALVYLGFWRKDYWMVSLSSLIILLSGLFILNNGVGDIILPAYKFGFGLVFIFIAIYFAFRTGIEILGK